jgi:GNAT superfamily N-acetyltransferase
VANDVFRSEGNMDGAELIVRADKFFARLARGFSVKVRDNGDDDDLRRACLDAGLEAFGEPVPQMICFQPLSGPTPIDGITVRSVDDEAGLRAFVSVNAAAYATYGMPPEVMADLFDETAIVLGDRSAHMVVAQSATVPVATAMIFESDGVASVQWVGTIPAARGTGLGALVTTAVTNQAFDRGATSCTLQASPMGAPVYERLGYETLYHYAECVRWPRPPGR